MDASDKWLVSSTVADITGGGVGRLWTAAGFIDNEAGGEITHLKLTCSPSYTFSTGTAEVKIY